MRLNRLYYANCLWFRNDRCRTKLFNLNTTFLNLNLELIHSDFRNYRVFVLVLRFLCDKSVPFKEETKLAPPLGCGEVNWRVMGGAFFGQSLNNQRMLLCLKHLFLKCLPLTWKWLHVQDNTALSRARKNIIIISMHAYVLSCFSHVSVTSRTVARQVPLPMGLSRQEY